VAQTKRLEINSLEAQIRSRRRTSSWLRVNLENRETERPMKQRRQRQRERERKKKRKGKRNEPSPPSAMSKIQFRPKLPKEDMIRM
jgi:hypothetical protein